ncbi:MAG: IPT/TIG domain-containing protein [Sandaracinaceae bacterium]|nr:IPT/TIG domain-containing protein [Sandaracinaceae bacterium]
MASSLVALGLMLVSGCKKGGDTRISDIAPRVGSTGGDQQVRITGHNFRLDVGYTVYFGNKRAPQVVVQNDEALIMTTPSVDEPGPVDIHIRADDGHAWKIAHAFVFNTPGVTAEQGGAGAAVKQNY